MQVRQVCGWLQSLPQVADGNLRTNMSPHTTLLSFDVEAWCTIHAVAIHESHRRHVEIGRLLNQGFRQGRAFKEAEGGAGVQFDVISHTSPACTNSVSEGRTRYGRHAP